MNAFFPGASGLMFNGGTFNASTTNNISQEKRGFDILMELIVTEALHNSANQYDAPKCHPGTRVAVLDDIMKWVIESDDEFIMWLFGPAGAGKSAIARKIAELAAAQRLIGTFFFSRTSSTRSTQDGLIPTLAYQLAVSIPGTRTHIEAAIEKDLLIFKKNLQTQIDTLLVEPFLAVDSMNTIPFPRLIVIDGLDECTDSQAQIAILDAISCSFTKHNSTLRWLVVSRPEIDIVTSFNGNEQLKSMHRRLALDDNYHPDDDIHLFFSDKFERIRCTHRLKSTLPIPWPSKESLGTLVKKSSGQFIFAATVVRFVESNRHRPTARLNIILGISAPGTINPFTELDTLYKQILYSVDDIQLTLRVLSLYTSLPHLAYSLGRISTSEHFLSLGEGDIDRALIDFKLPSLVSYNELSGEVKILHASLVDFLSDPRRSNVFYIDLASARTEFACRTLQCVKGPDGILAGNFDVFRTGLHGGWILNSQLRNEILNFDLDAFIMAVAKSPYRIRKNAILSIFRAWMDLIPKMGLDNGDEQLLTNRCKKSFESRIRKYQSDRRLQLLLTFAVVMPFPSPHTEVSRCPCLSILLEMYNHNLHLVDEYALNLRHSDGFFILSTNQLSGIITPYVDGDRYASAALHCMRFLSNSPTYSERNGSFKMSITYDEWRATSEMALELLCSLLEQANTLPEVLQFMSDHDINTTVRRNVPVIDIWWVDLHILAFLSRGDVCVNWRIISTIQRSLSPTSKSVAARQQPLGIVGNMAGGTGSIGYTTVPANYLWIIKEL